MTLPAGCHVDALLLVEQESCSLQVPAVVDHRRRIELDELDELLSDLPVARQIIALPGGRRTDHGATEPPSTC